jgi:hypothetical protein
MEKSFSSSGAENILKMAIEHGALKLVGSSGGAIAAKGNAECDALYLRTLLAELQKEPVARG